MRKLQTIPTVLRKAITVRGTGNDAVEVEVGSLQYPHGKIMTKEEYDNAGAPVGTLDVDATIALAGSVDGSKFMQINGGTTTAALSHAWDDGLTTVFNNQAYDKIQITPAGFAADGEWELVILLEGDF